MTASDKDLDELENYLQHDNADGFVDFLIKQNEARQGKKSHKNLFGDLPPARFSDLQVEIISKSDPRNANAQQVAPLTTRASQLNNHKSPSSQIKTNVSKHHSPQPKSVHKSGGAISDGLRRSAIHRRSQMFNPRQLLTDFENITCTFAPGECSTPVSTKIPNRAHTPSRVPTPIRAPTPNGSITSNRAHIPMSIKCSPDKNRQRICSGGNAANPVAPTQAMLCSPIVIDSSDSKDESILDVGYLEQSKSLFEGICNARIIGAVEGTLTKLRNSIPNNLNGEDAISRYSEIEDVCRAQIDEAVEKTLAAFPRNIRLEKICRAQINDAVKKAFANLQSQKPVLTDEKVSELEEIFRQYIKAAVEYAFTKFFHKNAEKSINTKDHVSNHGDENTSTNRPLQKSQRTPTVSSNISPIIQEVAENRRTYTIEKGSKPGKLLLTLQTPARRTNSSIHELPKESQNSSLNVSGIRSLTCRPLRELLSPSLTIVDSSLDSIDVTIPETQNVALQQRSVNVTKQQFDNHTFTIKVDLLDAAEKETHDQQQQTETPPPLATPSTIACLEPKAMQPAAKEEPQISTTVPPQPTPPLSPQTPPSSSFTVQPAQMSEATTDQHINEKEETKNPSLTMADPNEILSLSNEDESENEESPKRNSNSPLNLVPDISDETRWKNRHSRMLAKNRKQRQSSDSDSDWNDRSARVLNLRKRTISRKRPNGLPKKILHLNKAPNSPINGEEFAQELKRMSVFEILDLRKRLSSNMMIPICGRKSISNDMSLKQKKELDKCIQVEIINRKMKDGIIDPNTGQVNQLGANNKSLKYSDAHLNTFNGTQRQHLQNYLNASELVQNRKKSELGNRKRYLYTKGFSDVENLSAEKQMPFKSMYSNAKDSEMQRNDNLINSNEAPTTSSSSSTTTTGTGTSQIMVSPIIPLVTGDSQFSPTSFVTPPVPFSRYSTNIGSSKKISRILFNDRNVKRELIQNLTPNEKQNTKIAEIQGESKNDPTMIVTPPVEFRHRSCTERSTINAVGLDSEINEVRHNVTEANEFEWMVPIPPPGQFARHSIVKRRTVYFEDEILADNNATIGTCAVPERDKTVEVEPVTPPLEFIRSSLKRRATVYFGDIITEENDEPEHEVGAFSPPERFARESHPTRSTINAAAPIIEENNDLIATNEAQKPQDVELAGTSIPKKQLARKSILKNSTANLQAQILAANVELDVGVNPLTPPTQFARSSIKRRSTVYFADAISEENNEPLATNVVEKPDKAESSLLSPPQQFARKSHQKRSTINVAAPIIEEYNDLIGVDGIQNPDECDERGPEEAEVAPLTPPQQFNGKSHQKGSSANTAAPTCEKLDELVETCHVQDTEKAEELDFQSPSDDEAEEPELQSPKRQKESKSLKHQSVDNIPDRITKDNVQDAEKVEELGLHSPKKRKQSKSLKKRRIAKNSKRMPEENVQDAEEAEGLEFQSPKRRKESKSLKHQSTVNIPDRITKDNVRDAEEAEELDLQSPKKRKESKSLKKQSNANIPDPISADIIQNPKEIEELDFQSSGGEEAEEPEFQSPSDDEAEEPEFSKSPSDDEAEEPEFAKSPSEDDADEPEFQSPSDDESEEPEFAKSPSEDESEEPESSKSPSDDEAEEPESSKSLSDDEAEEPEFAKSPSDDEAEEPESSKSPSDDESEESEFPKSPSDDESEEPESSKSPSDDDADEPEFQSPKRQKESKSLKKQITNNIPGQIPEDNVPDAEEVENLDLQPQRNLNTSRVLRKRSTANKVASSSEENAEEVENVTSRVLRKRSTANKVASSSDSRQGTQTKCNRTAGRKRKADNKSSTASQNLEVHEEYKESLRMHTPTPPSIRTNTPKDIVGAVGPSQVNPPKDDHVFKVPSKPAPRMYRKRQAKEKQTQKTETNLEATDSSQLRRSKRGHVPPQHVYCYSQPDKFGIFQLLYKNQVKQEKKRAKQEESRKEQQRKSRQPPCTSTPLQTEESTVSATANQHKQNANKMPSRTSSRRQGGHGLHISGISAIEVPTANNEDIMMMHNDMDMDNVPSTSQMAKNKSNAPTKTTKKAKTLETRNNRGRKERTQEDEDQAEDALMNGTRQYLHNNNSLIANEFVQDLNVIFDQLKAASETDTFSLSNLKGPQRNLIDRVKYVTETSLSGSTCKNFGDIRLTTATDLLFKDLDGLDYAFYDTNDKRQYGYIRFKPKQKRPPKRARSSELNFIVIAGKFLVATTNEKDELVEPFTVSIGDLFTINKGARYVIQNIVDDISIIQVVNQQS